MLLKSKVQEKLMSAFIKLDGCKNVLLGSGAFITGLLVAPTAALADGSVTSSKTMGGILNNVSGIVIAAIALVAVVCVLFAAFEKFRGKGSTGKIIGLIVTAAILVGVCVVLANVDALTGLFGGVAKSGIDAAGNLAQEALGN